PLLDRVTPDQPRVIRSAARDDHHASYVCEELVVDRAEVTQVYAILAGGALADRLRDRIRLLIDLLEHERLITLLLRGVGVPVDLDRLALQRFSVGGQELDAIGSQDDDLVVA